jgi:hypothetical protein
MERNKKQYSQQNRRASKGRRSSSKESPIEQAITTALQQITPALKKYLKDISESEKRITTAKERQADAESKTTQALTDIIEITRFENRSTSNIKQSKKSPRVLSDHKKKVVNIIAKQRSAGKTFAEITRHLDEAKVATFSGRGKWHAQTVHRLYEDHILSEQA